MRLLPILITVVLSGCASAPSQPLAVEDPQPPLLADAYFGQPTGVVPLQQVFALTPQQKIDFQKKFRSQGYGNLAPNRRVYRYLEEYLTDFNFFSGTSIASESLSGKQGNCLSLAILTKSLANLAGVKVGYELTDTTPVYQNGGNTILSSQHVRTLLYDSDPNPVDGMHLLSPGGIRVDYFASRGVHTLRRTSEGEFYSMFYRNKAAEALLGGDYRVAFWNLKKALELHKNDAQAINMMALLHDRMGYTDYAERLYQFGIQNSREKMVLLSNYEIFLRRLGRVAEADIIGEKLRRYDDPNPFKWINLGDSAYLAGNYSEAIGFYRKASKMADYLHDPYLGIARAEFALGNLRAARRAIKKALANANKKSTVSLYQAKFEALTQLIERK